MATKPFDPTKPVQRRDGGKARIICTDAKGDWPIIALHDEGNREGAYCYMINGMFSFCRETSGNDLINVEPFKVEQLGFYLDENDKIWIIHYCDPDDSVNRFKGVNIGDRYLAWFRDSGIAPNTSIKLTKFLCPLPLEVLAALEGK